MTSENIGEHEDLALNDEDAENVLGGTKAKLTTDKAAITPPDAVLAIDPAHWGSTGNSSTG